jgi:hypothetical protein
MTLVNARSCGVSVAYLMVTLPLISAPMSPVLAQPSNVAIQSGYSMKAVVTGLNFPTAMTFQGDTIWVAEEGTATSPPAVKQIDNKGSVTTQLTATQLPAGTVVSPLTGIVFNRGWLWLVHRQTNSKNAPGVPVGVISRFKPSDPVGSFQTVIAGFPSFGDHPNSQIVFGANGRAYINGAAPTNSSVVGPDNGWAPNTPTLHDFPGVDIELSGIGYQTLIPFALDPAGGTKAAKITHGVWWRPGSCWYSRQGADAHESSAGDHRGRWHGVFFRSERRRHGLHDAIGGLGPTQSLRDRL